MATYSNATLHRGSSGGPITLGTSDVVNWDIASEQHKVSDNSSAAFEILQGSNSYFKVVTTNSSEAVSFGNSTTNPSISFAGTGTASFGGDVEVTGNLLVSGTTTTINSTAVTIKDNIQFVNSGPSGTKNSGYASERYQTANDLGTGDIVTDAEALVQTIADIGDQTGMSDTEVTLAGGNAGDDYYVGMWLLSDADNVRLVTAYNGTTKVATIDSAWDTQPADNEAISIYSGFSGVIFNETTNRWVAAHLTGTGGTNAILDHIGFQVGGLVVDDSATFADNSTIVMGTGSDLTLAHDGTNSTITNVTGDLILDLAHSTHSGAIRMRLGVDDSTQSFAVYNDSNAQRFSVNGAGAVTLYGSQTLAASGGNLIVAGGFGSGGLSLRTNGTLTANALDIAHNGPITSYLNFVPSSDSSKNLGTSSVAWATGYFDTLTSLDANDRLALGTAAQVVVALPQFTDANRDSNITASAGDFLYNTDADAPQFYDGSAWVTVGAGGASSLDAAYNGGVSITVDNGAVALTQAKTTENVGTLSIVYAADDFTGTSHGLVVDMSGADSFSNGTDIYGVKLAGKTNAGAGNSVGLYIADFDVGLENTNSLVQSGAAEFSGNLTNVGGEILLSGGNLQLNDDLILSFGTDDDADLRWVSGSSLFDINVAGSIEIDASAAIAIESSGGAITIGGDAVNQNISLGTDGARTITIGSVASGDTTALNLRANGEVTAASASNIILDAGGEIVTENDILSAGALVDGDLLALNSSGKLAKADANSDFHIAGSAAAAVGGADTAVKLAGMPGSVMKVSTDISGLSKGTVVYLSETAGAVTATMPSTSGAKIIRAGIVVDNGTTAGDGFILFQPQFMYEVA